MSNDEINLQTSISKSKSVVLRNSNRVSFSETINESLPPENIYEAPSSSSATNRATTSSSSPALKRNTPILFSTNRGLHLRVTSSNNNNYPTSAKSGSKTGGSVSAGSGGSSMSQSRSLASITIANTTSINSSYSITFCDLERWSTNRANTVNLEDTFTIARPAVVPHSAASGSLASSSLRFLPQKSNGSIRFKGYSRFDIE